MNEAALRAWATWAATRDSKYQLGATTAQVMAKIDRIYRAAPNGPVEPDANLGELLDAILSPAMSQTISAQTAIVCADNTAPRDPQVYWRDIQQHRTTEPHFGPLTRMISPAPSGPYVRRSHPPESPTPNTPSSSPPTATPARSTPTPLY